MNDRRHAVVRLALIVGALLVLGACASAAPTEERVPAPLGPRGGRYRVLAPPPSAGNGPFPAVYFLHDFWSSDAVLWRQGVAQRLARRMETGDLPPVLLVAPEGDRSFWADSFDGARRYATWAAERLPGQVAARHPVVAGRAGRAYVGISMGGLGAVRAALREPGEVGAVASVSGLLVPLDGDYVRAANPFYRMALKRVFGRRPDEAALHAADPYRALAAMAALPATQRPRILLLAGTEDKYRLDEASARFAAALRDHGIGAELRLSPGRHDWRYWRGSVEEAIAWTARELHALREARAVGGRP